MITSSNLGWPVDTTDASVPDNGLGWPESHPDVSRETGLLPRRREPATAPVRPERPEAGWHPAGEPEVGAGVVNEARPDLVEDPPAEGATGQDVRLAAGQQPVADSGRWTDEAIAALGHQPSAAPRDQPADPRPDETNRLGSDPVTGARIEAATTPPYDGWTPADAVFEQRPGEGVGTVQSEGGVTPRTAAGAEVEPLVAPPGLRSTGASTDVEETRPPVDNLGVTEGDPSVFVRETTTPAPVDDAVDDRVETGYRDPDSSVGAGPDPTGVAPSDPVATVESHAGAGVESDPVAGSGLAPGEPGGAERMASASIPATPDRADSSVTYSDPDRPDSTDGEDRAENLRRHVWLTGQRFHAPLTPPRIMTVANQKGGVGKTTTTVNIAAAMAQSGLRVLVADLDPQGNASTALGIDHHAEVLSIYDVLVDDVPLADVVQPCTTVDGLWCAPATIDLAGAEIELVSLVARETRFRKALRAAMDGGLDYDYILIDCPPSLGLLTVNAMVAADEVFIPIQCEYYALEGLSQLLKNVELVQAHLNPRLHVSTILLTMYDGRTRLSAQVAEEVREHFPHEVLRTTVPRSVRVSEAPSFGETVMTYDPASSGALAYLEAASEIADRGAHGQY